MQRLRHLTISQSPHLLLITITVTIFVSETVVMFLIPLLPSFSLPAVALIDSILLIALLFPILYTFVFRQSRLQIIELSKADEQLTTQINERNQFKKMLEQERDKLKNILDSMQDGVYIVNQQYDIQYINPMIEEEFGPVKGRKCHEYFHDLPEVCSWCKNQDVFAGKTVQWEWYSSKTGKTYDLFDTPLRNVDRSVSKLEFFHDITDHKRAEEELRKYQKNLEEMVETRTTELKTLNEQLQNELIERKRAENTIQENKRINEMLLDSLPHPAMLISRDRKILAANRIAHEIGAKIEGLCWYEFGHTEYISEEHKLYLKQHKDEIPPSGIKCTFCLADESLASNSSKNCEANAFGKLWDIWWVPVPEDVYLHYAIDITERKQTEEVLKKALEESKQRQTEISALLKGSRAVLEYHKFTDSAQSIFDSCKNLIGGTAGYVALLSKDEIRNEVLFLDSGGLPCAVDPDLPMPIRGLREEAYRNGKTVYHNNFSKSEYVKFMPEGHVTLSNVLFAPLVIRGKTVGLLGLANKTGGFTENDARIASAFGELAAIALVNKWAEETLQKAHDELEQRVKERTVELVTANEQLKIEIKDRKRSEEMLRRSEERYRSLVIATAQVVWTTNAQGEAVEDIPTWRAFTGQSELEIKGWGWINALHPKDRHQVAAIWSHAVETRSLYDTEYRVRRHDGEYRYLAVRGVPVVEKDHSIREWVGTCTDITERKRAEEALKESEKQLRYLSSQLLTIQERERKRISREMHDELGQSLALLKIRLSSIEKNLHKDQIELREECEHNLQYIDQVIENVRRLSRDLSPSVLEDLGLTASLQWLINNFIKSYNITVTHDIMDIDLLFSQEAQIIIYRILQEALTNIGKHAQAKNVSLVIKKHDDRISFFVEDDGKGFDVNQVVMRDDTERGLGLVIMNERAGMLGGFLDLWSQEGKGTRITFSIPIEKGRSV